jgi:tRNA A37 threonylcarbamoyladenosine synthetase subunit TsaC/SUA5/YrdC
MAVTSANTSGQPAATTVLEAATQLGSAVSVYLDAGPSVSSVASTILDCTHQIPVILRAGAVSAAKIQEVLGDVELGS